jgi:hypothetical protein
MSDGISTPAPKSRKISPRLLNGLLIIALIIVGVLFVKAEKTRRAAEEKLKQTSQQLDEVKNSTQKSGAEAAKEVLNKVKALIDLPTDPEPTVATIVDVDSLRKSNDFYNKAKNGDNLIITADRAVLYDSQRNIIIDVVPVQLNKNASPSPTPTPKPAQ